jgi:hypothetical protein
MSSSTGFFNEPKERSLDKLWLLGGYLKPLTYKLGSQCGPRKPWKHLWVVDGCAGAGAYKELDAAGRVQDGSPLVAAKWAEQERIRQRYPVVRSSTWRRTPSASSSLSETSRRIARSP